MDVHISLEGRRGLSAQIYRQLREAMRDGRLRAGEPLPPTRELARRLGVSRNTVSAAYDRLAAEGLLTSRVGAGTFVHGDEPGSRGAPASPLRPRPVWDAIRMWPEPLAGIRYDFRAGLPDMRRFPYQAWRRLITDELRPGAGSVVPEADDPGGHPGLRAAIARHAGVSRSVRAGADDVIVTSGFQQALDLIARVLLEPGDLVAVEDPGYPPVRLLLRSLGMRVAEVPVDAEGLRVDALPGDARAVCVTPSHQYPLGMAMSLPRRRALLDWARRRDTVIVEDDYDTEFRYGGRPIAPLQSLDGGGRVLYVGTFSKVMRPVLRLGFVIAPPSLRRALRTARYVADWHSDLPVQAALARFIEEGLYARHIRRMRREYERRHQRIAAALSGELADRLTTVPSSAGLHLAALLPPDSDDVEIARRAAAGGVALFPLSQFGGSVQGLVLGYGAIATAEIDEGLRRLGSALA